MIASLQVSYKNLVRLAPHRLMMVVFEDAGHIVGVVQEIGSRGNEDGPSSCLKRYDMRARLSSAAGLMAPTSVPAFFDCGTHNRLNLRQGTISPTRADR